MQLLCTSMLDNSNVHNNIWISAPTGTNFTSSTLGAPVSTNFTSSTCRLCASDNGDTTTTKVV